MDQVNTHQALPFAHHALDALFQSVWTGVGIKNVEKMAPKSTHGEVCWHIKSFVQMSFTQNFKEKSICGEDYPKSSKIDNLGSGTIDVENKQSKAPLDKISRVRKMTDISQISDSKSKILKTKTSKFLETETKSFQNKNVEKTSQKNDPYIKVQQSYQQPESSKDDMMRRERNDRDIEKAKTKKIMEELQIQRKARKLNNQKAFRDKKSNVTYDYEGSFFGINQQKPPNEKIIKLSQTFSDNRVVPKQFKSIQTSRIELYKQKQSKSSKSVLQKEVPLFNNTPLLITEIITDDKIQAGVKITEQIGQKDKIVREKKHRKLSGIKMYRLNEFKNYSKDIHFKEHPRQGSKSRKSAIDISYLGSTIQNKQELNRTISNAQSIYLRDKSKSSFINKANQTNRLIDVALGRGLPFIRTKGYRMNDLGSQLSMQSSQSTSFYKKSSKQKNKISIENTQLFEYNIGVGR